MAGISTYLKSAFAQTEPRAALKLPPNSLLGVADGFNGKSSEAILQGLNINSVFDLAMSSVFAEAVLLLDATENSLNVVAEYGVAPTGILSPKVAATDVTRLAEQPPDALKVVDDAGIVNDLQSILGIGTVRDLALWPPYVAAKQVLDFALNPPESVAGSDPEAPADLIPKSGEYPTERVFYSTLLFDSIASTDPNNPPKDLASSGPIDPSGAADLTYGFQAPAEGAMLTYQQSWYAQGVALGQLLHSVALAPGEATKIAMVDWFRRTTGTRTETGTETEQLTNDTTHARSISEVTSAVATDAQSGFTKTTTTSSSDSSGLSLGGFDFGFSSGGSSSSGSATTVSSSTGRRTLDATMNQNIMDSTHQAANAVRNRRATVIQEVSEAETVTATTRVVANYNHMHALSVQYYEVVQVYRVEVLLRKVDKLLFIPLKMIDFATVTLNPQQQTAIYQAATTPAVAQAFSIARIAGSLRVQTPPPPVVNAPGSPPTSSSAGATPAASAQSPFGLWNQSPSVGPLSVAPNSWALAQAISVKPALGAQVQAVDPQTLSLPNDLTIVAITVIGSHDGDTVVLMAPDGTVTQCPIASTAAQLAQAVALSNVQSISLVTKTSLDAGAVAIFQLQMPAGTKSVISVPLQTGGPAQQTMVIAQISNPSSGVDSGLAQEELQLNRLYYNQVLWRNLDSATIALLLSPYAYKGRPVLEQIDPTPVAIVANYLVFRMPLTPDFSYKSNGANGGSTSPAGDDQLWAKWLDDHGLSSPSPTDQIVPLPSGGVFAEAVQGRFNSAEKLDVTRFWNWQDSPIPLAPSDIAPVSTASRDNPPSLEPGTFGPPLVNIVSPTALPDPSGLAAILNAIQNGNMFRDMSGLAATVGLLQAGIQGNQQAAGQAAQQAGQNMANTQQFIEAMGQLALQAAGLPSGAVPSGPATKNISNAGAALNQGVKLDSHPLSTGGGSQSGTGGGGSGSNGTPAPAGGQNGGSASSPTSTSGSDPSSTYTAQAFRSLVGTGQNPEIVMASAPSSTPTVPPAYPVATTLTTFTALSDTGNVAIPIQAGVGETGAFFFDTGMKIDVDGSPRAYYPPDGPLSQNRKTGHPPGLDYFDNGRDIVVRNADGTCIHSLPATPQDSV